MKAYNWIIIMVCIDLATLFVNQMDIFSNVIQITAKEIPIIGITAIVFTLAGGAIGSIVIRDSSMAAVYFVFSGVYWFTYTMIALPLRQIIPGSIWLMVTPLVGFVWVAALLQLKTGGWEYNV